MEPNLDEDANKERDTAVTAVIPTYHRELTLVDTIRSLLNMRPAASEILIVDQTMRHEPETAKVLERLNAEGSIRWVRVDRPSIPQAMNEGLRLASHEIVLFLDDDIIPDPGLVGAHFRAHAESGHSIVAGQVLQPGEEPLTGSSLDRQFRFCSNQGGFISELMGGNFSIKREIALRLGGFDENFVRVAYRFEAEFAARAAAEGEKIWFEPTASIRHLKASSGGTRTYGDHLRTIRPGHAVGEYYYLFRSKNVEHRMLKMLKRPFRAIRTRHHLTHPWWIPVTLTAEFLGFVWASMITVRGPRLLRQEPAENS